MFKRTVSLVACAISLAACGAQDDQGAGVGTARSGGSSGQSSSSTGGVTGSGGTSAGGSSGNSSGSGGSGAAAAGGSATAGSSGDGQGGATSSGAGGAETSPASDAGASGGSAGTADASADEGGSGGPSTPAPPGLHKIFDGKSLDGWISYGKTAGGAIGEVPGNWDVQDGALHSVGNIRGVLATKDDYDEFRLIFSIRHLPPTGNNHQPCILLWGTRPPPNDAIGGIQVQAPFTSMWDYRVGKNKPIGGMKVGTVKIDASQWSQCEVLAHKTGEFRLACCQLTGTGPCKATEILHFTDATAGHKGPIGLQTHNGGLHDEYKDISIEVNPTVNDLITTK